jgi:glycosyltransferase involved in cell wall biosynthesis
MPSSGPALEHPLVSVIVPARNEESTLPVCLPSIVQQTGVSFEVIVVDDSSTDRTRPIAESFADVRVVEAGALPPDWTGKNNAMRAGARQAKGEWLLFTDADTTHKPGSLARAVSEAEQHGAALLSYSPEQEVRGFWENAVLPVIFAELARTYRPRDVCNPNSPVAAANGQYLMISREAYDAVGGHDAIRNNILEDVCLARAVKASGRRLRFRYGGDAVRTHMYRGWAQIKEGWTKNLAILFASPVQLALLRFAQFGVIIAGLVIGLSATRPRFAVPAGASALVLYLLFVKRIRRAQFNWQANALALLGLPLFSYLLLRSRTAYRTGNVVWKGRAYDPAKITDSCHQVRRAMGTIKDVSA